MIEVPLGTLLQLFNVKVSQRPTSFAGFYNPRAAFEPPLPPGVCPVVLFVGQHTNDAGVWAMFLINGKVWYTYPYSFGAGNPMWEILDSG